MKIEIAAKTEKGKVRSTNQDSFCIERIDKDTYACVVCDGMGGAKGGSEASCIAAVAFMDHLKKLYTDPSHRESHTTLLKRSLNAANSAVYSFATLHPELEGMGTTLVAFILSENDLSWINVGDSRLYAANGEGLDQISDDHSLVWEMVKKGMMSAEEAENAPMKNIITRAVGISELVESDVNIIRNIFDKYSYILLCSDGLTNMTPHEDIYKILTGSDSTERKIDSLFEFANNSGGYDNITAVLLSVKDDKAEKEKTDNNEKS